MTILIAVVNLGVILACAFQVWKKQVLEIRRFFWPAWFVKILAGMVLGLIYRDYYLEGDTLTLFNLAKEQTDLFFNQPGAYFDFLWNNGSGEWKGVDRANFFVKIISVVNIITVNNYWITSLWFSFISFLGSWYFLVIVTRFFPAIKFMAALALLFFPSVVLWSSGIIKESISLAALFVLSGIYLKVMMKQKGKGIEFLVALIAAIVLWKLKYYWMAVFLPVAITSCIIQYGAGRWSVVSEYRVLFWFALFALFGLGASFIHPNFNATRFPSIVVENNTAFNAISDPSNLIHYNSLEASWSSIVVNAPWALVSGLFRPFPGEGNSILKLLASAENFAVLVLFVASLARWKDFLRSPHRTLILSVLVYVMVLSIFLALSTPNLGSLERYKVGFMPFFILLMVCNNPLVDAVMNRLANKIKGDEDREN